MQVSLKTDYRDYYDNEFLKVGDEGATFEWTRILRDPKMSITKANQLNMLKQLGFETPKHGTVAQIAPESDFLVIYLDDHQDSNDHIFRVESNLALYSCPQKYCREYLSSASATKYRLIQIGYRTFWQQHFDHQWTKPSEMFGWWNKYSAFQKVPEYPRPVELNDCPIFTLDFVDCENGRFKSVTDLNISPRLANTGIENAITPIGIHAAVQLFLNKVFP